MNQFKSDGSFMDQFRKLNQNKSEAHASDNNASLASPSKACPPAVATVKRVSGVTIGRPASVQQRSAAASHKTTGRTPVVAKLGGAAGIFSQSSSDEEEADERQTALWKRTAKVARSSTTQSPAPVARRGQQDTSSSADGVQSTTLPKPSSATGDRGGSKSATEIPAKHPRSRWDRKAAPPVQPKHEAPIAAEKCTEPPVEKKKKRTFREEAPSLSASAAPPTQKGQSPPTVSPSTSALSPNESQDAGTTAAPEDILKLQMAMKARAIAVKAIERLNCPVTEDKPDDPFFHGEANSDGTVEHARRYQEMLKTKAMADEASTATAASSSGGKHHMMDFLPDDEKKKFTDRLLAARAGKPVPQDEEKQSAYFEQRLQDDNKGFQLLQKMGWEHGKGLGASSQGITAPVSAGRTAGSNEGLGSAQTDQIAPEDDLYTAYRKQCMNAYKHRPNPLNNPRRKYY